MTKMELHRLLAHYQAQTNLRVSQSLNATQRHLRFAAAQVFIVHNSLDNSLKGTIGRAALNSLRIRFDPPRLTPGDNLLGSEDAIDSSVIASSITVRSTFAIDTKLSYQAFESPSDCAQADDTGQFHQSSHSENIRLNHRLVSSLIHRCQHRGIQTSLHGRMT